MDWSHPRSTKAGFSEPSESSDRAFWQQRIKDWYPRWSQRTYFVPPVVMNTTHYKTVDVSGQQVHVSVPPVTNPQKDGAPKLLESDVREERTMRRVLFCLRELARRQNEVMFVLSQFQFVDYLGEPSFAEVTRRLPRPGDLKEKGKDRGDFDVLILHREFGVLVCEVKSVGDAFLSMTLAPETEDDIVAKKVAQAVGQLQKGLDVLKHVMSDMELPPRVKAALVLPNVTSDLLDRVLKNRLQLKQDLCLCLGICDTEDPVTFCVTKDVLSDGNAPYDVTDFVIKGLGQWWQIRMSSGKTDPAMSEEVYLDLLARFTGPASTVRVVCTSLPRLHMDLRTEGELVSETGYRFTRLMLTPHQLSVLASDLDLVFITGPPGTGKTVMLYLTALDWHRGGFSVHIVSTNRRSLAASHSLFRQLQQPSTDIAAKQGIFLHEFDLWREQQPDVERAFSTLMQAADAYGGLNLIMDEAWVGNEFTELCTKLHEGVAPGSLRIWTASIFHAKRPPLLTEVVLSEPLRSSPMVILEVERSERIKDGYIMSYTPRSCPPPSEGPPPVYLYHQGKGHEGEEPRVCSQCGDDLAGVFRDLHVGVVAPGRPSSAKNEPVLSFRDVFILTSMGKVSDTDGIVQGLMRNGIPVKVLKTTGESTEISSLIAAAAAGDDDVVVVANEDDVRGLERKVVVWLQMNRATSVGQQAYDEIWGRVLSMSRCTGQLVCVMLPPV